ncbi:SDR family NAD(P)-dependent oxidoreductase [Actinoallomurus soli]|uniref:SDR family NAD(P)-dependent oxidoreductase n=1 Tax=Actinoallomurus soli TaxID=2952535 RepID=UPI002093D963|nr:SDR family oxidoreductase [Actinoallomurus soli]MCO5971358.1 SDR family oxidoreductase [Actinoallomurus soli]
MNDSRIALVTGASRGFGRSMAAHLTDAGVWVIGTYNRSATEAQEFAAQVTKNGGRLAFLQLDLSRSELFPAFADSVSRLLHDWGAQQFNYLINNAGIGFFPPYAETSEEQFDELVAVNLKAPYFLTQRLLPLLADGGRILNLSTALTRAVVPGASAYAAVKGAVEVLTRYQAVELADRRIRVNTLRGGATESDFGGGIMHTDAVKELSANVIALGRIGTPDDLGAAVPALLSTAFGWANGGCIELSGGQSL